MWRGRTKRGTFVAQLPCAVAATADFKVPVDVTEVKLDLPQNNAGLRLPGREKSVALIGDEPLTAPVALTLLLTAGLLSGYLAHHWETAVKVGRPSVKLQAFRSSSRKHPGSSGIYQLSPVCREFHILGRRRSRVRGDAEPD